MIEVLQVSAPWLIIWGFVFAFLGIIKLAAKIFKFKHIDDSIKF
jgi:hypothetical protein